MTTELLERTEVNHKGWFCHYKLNLLCQEGYCSECAIPNQRKMMIYIAGPYSIGDVVLNVRNACLAANVVRAKGHIPVIPHLMHLWHIITPKTQREWLDIGLDYIPRMDAVLRLDGESVGADNEVALAKALGIKVYYSLAGIKDAV